MTSAGTLARYISWRFLTTILSVFALCLVLIFFVDFIELLRRAGKFGSVSALELFMITLLRLPSFSEIVLPFAVLIGSIGGFLMLSRSSELVVIRAAGISAWQFIVPGIAVACGLGMFAVGVYNPIAASSKAASERMYAEAFGKEDSILTSRGSGAWLRQDGVDGQSILHAKLASNQGQTLTRVTALQYDRDLNFFERIDSESAELRDGRWEMHKTWVNAVGREPEYHDNYILSTYLTPTQVQTSIGSVFSISFWELPNFIDLAEKAGLPALDHRLQYQMLLSRPLLLAVMVLVAATCSLKSFRFGNIQSMVIAGLGGGFAFFVFAETSRNLGLSGLAAPVVAAWAPVVIAGCLATTVLLYQEDG
ncbi:MAG: LPS export ABC transporter permease LptG [Pseudomonadota bacterium]|nr:LPS export ABC transporter permease LptG [Pseudomonadota bacterium]